MNLFQVKSFLKYQLKSRHKKGYGLHSPFVFNLVRHVIYCQNNYYAFEQIRNYRKELEASDAVIQMVDYGAGSSVFESSERKVSRLVRNSSIAPKYGEALFKIIQHLNPPNIIELGTSVGISSLYFALSDKRRKVYTIEGCSETANIAKQAFNKFNCENVNQIIGQFYDALPDLVAHTDELGMVFFDGHHAKQATLDYFQICLSKVGNDTVFVFDDIHWSEGMEEAWKIICSHPKVTVTIDLFQIGLVFFKKECQKQDFIVRY